MSTQEALIEEIKGWGTANPTALDDDWKGFNRILHQFGDRWRDAGHLSEKPLTSCSRFGWQPLVPPPRRLKPCKN